MTTPSKHLEAARQLVGRNRAKPIGDQIDAVVRFVEAAVAEATEKANQSVILTIMPEVADRISDAATSLKFLLDRQYAEVMMQIEVRLGKGLVENAIEIARAASRSGQTEREEKP